MNGDFDFLTGEWDVTNRRLVERHVGSERWDEFPGRSVVRPFFDGAGNFDEITFPTKGFSGATVRLREPAADDWTITWINSRDGLLTSPMRGRFEGGVGTFYGDDTDDGRAIRGRFIWSRIMATSCHWEQAFSTDGGHTWETNWTMAFVRRAVEDQESSR